MIYIDIMQEMQEQGKGHMVEFGRVRFREEVERRGLRGEDGIIVLENNTFTIVTATKPAQ